ncbi:ABC transporter ATP-binding protein [Ktedonobacter sp. SOSP1-85]|uniref:ABC transporter ATP-binding protein n=1 Tax=Ktedonobacter sp. SOSP1-85 TaxID=2778367 RepID=UPI0019157B39|nr:ABC transporter ATP-binding protein [Ktedonobacter sp. SOSP1-85]GHO74543.1 ABC transporter ATP-binding protein [Ktedonobacter sp. SOSP1-85]
MSQVDIAGLARQVSAHAASERAGETVLRTHNLTKQYKQRVVVDNLNLDIRRGEIYGFLGPNGAGKTTTIRMILGLIRPTSGSVEVMGQDTLAHRSEVLPRVGALIETPALYRYMSGRDNLLALSKVLGGVPAKRIDEVLAIVGLTGRQKDKVRTYSLGMRQRLGIAVALLQDPELLLLDEPANGLDPAGIVEMRDFLHRLTSEGKTILMSSHLLTEVQQICDRVAIINFGKLITETTVKDLTTGKGEFTVKLEQAAQALALLKEQPWGANARLDEQGDIVTLAPNNRGRNLNAFLTQAGFMPDELKTTKYDLEETFLRLTDGHTGI